MKRPFARPNRAAFAHAGPVQGKGYLSPAVQMFLTIDPALSLANQPPPVLCSEGDQAGSEASPGVITRRSFRPVTSTDQIWEPWPPSRVRVNIRTRPLGAQVGPSSSQPEEISRSPPPSGRITPISKRPPSCLVKAIRSPRGDHTGVPLRPAPKLMRCWFDPSAFMT